MKNDSSFSIHDKIENSIGRNFSGSSFVLFIMPAILTMLMAAVYEIVDAIFIERYAGDLAIAAVNLYSPVFDLLVGFGFMFGTGANALILKSVGENDCATADRVYTHSFLLTLITSLLLTFFLLYYRNPIMAFLGSSPINEVYLRPYYTILNACGAIIVIESYISTILFGEGDIFQCALISAIGGIINIVLDFVFMGIFHWGIIGAAVATAIGYFAELIYFFYLIFRRSSISYHFVRTGAKINELWTVCLNGSSELINNLASASTTVLMNNLIFIFCGEMGQSALCALIYFQYFVICIFMGVNLATEPIISFHYGAKNAVMMKKTLLHIGEFTAVVSLVAAGISFFASDAVASIFFPDRSSEVFAMTSIGLQYGAVGCLFTGFNTVISGFFTAVSNGFLSGLLSFLRTFFILIIAMLALSHYFQATGIWIAWSVTEAVSAVISLIVFLANKDRYFTFSDPSGSEIAAESEPD